MYFIILTTKGVTIEIKSNQIKSIFIYMALFIQKKVPQSASQK